jgi:hypothetical protein
MGQKMRENPDGHTGFAVASGQAVAGQEAATGLIAEAELGAGAASGQITKPTTGRSRRAKAGTGNRQTGTGSQDVETGTESQRTARQKTTGNPGRTANLAEHQPRTCRQPLSANTDIADTQAPEYQETRHTGTGAGIGLADVLRAIASLSEADRELLLQLLQTLRGANT